MEEKRRQYGPDALRILAILFVFLLHTMGLGGITPSTERLSLNYSIAWIMEIIAYCAVDCFVLLAGYFGYSPKTRYAHLVNLWIEAAFYSVAITLFFAVWHGNFSPAALLKAFFPLTTAPFWYFSAYFGMYLLTPFLNAAIRSMGKKETVSSLAVLLLFFTTIPCLNRTIFGLEQGYSVLWFCVVYFVGAALRKYEADAAVSSKKLVLGILLSVFVTWFSKLLAEAFFIYVLGKNTGAGLLVRYLSPTILFTAVCFLLLFLRWRPGEKTCQIIRFLTPSVFGQYLIQDHPLIRTNAISERFTQLASESPLSMIVWILVIVVLSFLLCLCVDLLRRLLFLPLHIPRKLNKLENTIRHRLSRPAAEKR